MLFMVVEHFRAGPGPVYGRAALHGRMLPDGLEFIDSWIVDDERMDRCFQLVHTDDPALFDVWIERWRDLVDFEIIPVIQSEAAARKTNVTWTSTEPDE
ncbi:MAG TPA: DUF3303 family protein [Ilumatobacter sp.]|nr:DUF3303 family protein [Ilumatobacter sp.]